MRTLVSAPRIGYQRVNGAGSFWGRGGSASVKDRTLTLTVVNPHATNACETEIAIRGAAPGAVRATTIAASELAAHNTFDQPHSV